MIVEKQIRMARVALGWSIQTLSENCTVSVRTIKRIESEGGLDKANPANLWLIRTTLETAGVEFIGGANDGPGVRLWDI
tara:strand:+ start:13465 stop:13701 length:237 start_codon:yes stop_codon:yes gene_type:complete